MNTVSLNDRLGSPRSTALPAGAVALLTATIALVAATACGSDEDTAQPLLPPEVPTDPACDRTITVPDGLCARIYHPGVGAARHLTVAPNGDVFVAIRNRGNQRGGVVALRDGNGDHQAEQTQAWGEQEARHSLGDGTLYWPNSPSALSLTVVIDALAPPEHLDGPWRITTPQSIAPTPMQPLRGHRLATTPARRSRARRALPARTHAAS